jgi:DNA processing protein
LREGATICTSAQDVVDALDRQRAEPMRHDLFSEAEERVETPVDLWDEIDFIVAERAPALREGETPIGFDAGEAVEADASDATTRIVNLLGPSPVAVDELVRAAGAPAQDVRRILLELELAGRVTRVGVNLVALL